MTQTRMAVPGDPRRDQVFTDAFTAHRDGIHRLARGLTTSRQDAEDLVQDTFLLALRGWRRRPPEDPGAWFAVICRNAARSVWRRRAARPAEVRPGDGWFGALPADTDTAVSALAALQATAVRAALAGLPESQRQAITLVDLRGFSSGEVARMLGCPRGTVLARVHRGRKALATVLHDVYEAPVPRAEGAREAL